ncbi:MAG: dehydrogenase [Acidimicrobiales bacterium]
MPPRTVTAAGVAQPPGPGAGRPAKVRARAPLRLGLAGGGTDVSPYCDLYGGVVLNATVDRYCYATLEERDDDRVVLAAPDVDTFEELDAGAGSPEAGTALPLHAAVYRRMCQDYSIGSPALTITTMSDAPAGSGLGSSSAVVVAVVEAFREYFSLPLGDYDVARLAYDIERGDCGLKGGRQDQYAATFGGFNLMEFWAHERIIVNPLRLKAAVVQELEASLVVFHTGASRSSADIIAEQVAHIDNGDQDRLEATHALRAEALGMKEALLAGDLHAVAGMLGRGWEAKKRIADGVSTGPIEEVFAVARAGGALAGKVSGAGGGGHIMFLVEPTERPRLAVALAGLGSGEVRPIHFVDEGAVAWTVQ